MKQVIQAVTALIGISFLTTSVYARPPMLGKFFKNSVVVAQSFSSQARKAKVAHVDMGGTRGDSYCSQSLKAFEEAVESLNVEKENVHNLIYDKMGMPKKTHLREILFSDQGIDLFAEVNGRYPQEADLDNAYKVFVKVQRELLKDGYPIIPGYAQAEKEMRDMGLSIIGTTDYDSDLRDCTDLWLRYQGSDVDDSITPEEAGGGGWPSPEQIFEVMKKAYKLRGEFVKPHEIVTFDDTSAGIEAGRNAGTWCVGIAGTSILQNQYPGDFTTISKVLLRAGAHFVIDSVREAPDVVQDINIFMEDPLMSPETFVARLIQKEESD